MTALASVQSGSRAAAQLQIDLQGRIVMLAGRTVRLTAREYQLIALLHAAPGRLFGRDEILERLWGLDFPGDSRIVDNYVKRLRVKLGPEAVQTVRGLGYRSPPPEVPGVAQPHLERLPPEARLLTRLAERILHVTEPAPVIDEVHSLLSEQYQISGVSLWTAPTATLPEWQRLVQAGVPLSSVDLLALPGNPACIAVPLGTGLADQPPWAMLMFGSERANEVAWAARLRPTLDAVAGLVNPALRLNQEMNRRQHAEQQLRRLNHTLESRVKDRTAKLAQANAGLQFLYDLAQQLAGAGSADEVLSLGLDKLTELTGAASGSVWAAEPGAAWRCLAACSLDGHNPLAASELAGLLHRTLAGRSNASHSVQTAAFQPVYWPDGRRVLTLALSGAWRIGHVLALVLPGNVSESNAVDANLLDAAAHTFASAFERQMQAQTLEQAALQDELTGLPNRRALLDDLSAELAYAQRHAAPLTLSLYEIQDIRLLNRRLGFSGGNDLIRALATELTSLLRAEDRVYRLGGALLASLVRAGAPQTSALSARLQALVGRFGVLRVSHVHAPGEADQVSAMLHLALIRLERPGDLVP
ncbi:winged helix-turn-helix domain-containing protein [Deinococcus sp.]|uniref:winged helix-turn-helix domain-containing protein n=1 Tax=Deinococcus sp. TaxID=47478 RepID=UPI003B5CF1F9